MNERTSSQLVDKLPEDTVSLHPSSLTPRQQRLAYGGSSKNLGANSCGRELQSMTKQSCAHSRPQSTLSPSALVQRSCPGPAGPRVTGSRWESIPDGTWAGSDSMAPIKAKVSRQPPSAGRSPFCGQHGRVHTRYLV